VYSSDLRRQDLTLKNQGWSAGRLGAHGSDRTHRATAASKVFGSSPFRTM
jgi:hypothetical protein